MGWPAQASRIRRQRPNRCRRLIDRGLSAAAGNGEREVERRKEKDSKIAGIEEGYV